MEAAMAVDGTWNITLKTMIGERKATVVLKTEGASLVAKERLLYDGAVDGDDVSWKTDITSPVSLTLAFKGKVSGNTIAGAATTALGKWPFSGVRG
jgi:hypothetical protein